MKKVMFLCMLLAIGLPAIAVNTLTENFSGPTMGFTVLASGSQGSNTVGTFDGSGHYVMTQDSYIYRGVNTGNFNMQTVFNAINMGTPPEPNATNYRIFNYLVNHTGDNVEYFLVFFHKNAVGIQFAVDAKIGGTAARQYTEILTSLTSATLQVTWDEATKTYVISAGFNGGAVTQKVSLVMTAASHLNRTEYFYGVSAPTPTSEPGKPSVSLDQYTMTAGQTPIGQIESFNDIASSGWTAQQPSYMIQDTTTFHESTGSMRIDFPASQTWWDNWTTLNRNLNLNYATSVKLTFWAKVSSVSPVGKERIANVTLIDTSNRATRYSAGLENALPATTNWYKVSCPLSAFTPDGAAVDMNSIKTVQIKFTSWDKQDPAGSSVWIDDLQLENNDPNQIDSFDNIAATNWGAQDVSFLFQDTTVTHEGSGSLRVDFTPLAPWDNWINASKPLNLSDANIALTLWTKTTLQGKERITNVTIWDSSSRAARFSFENVPATTDWYKVTCPLVGFVPDTDPIDLSNIIAINIKFTTWDAKPATLGSVWLDDLRIEVIPILPDPTYYYAEKVASGAIVLDGATSDWTNLKSWTQPQKMEGPAGDLDRKHDLRYAWDANNLYMLIQETVVDNDPWAGADEYWWAANPYKCDTVGLFDFPNKAVYDSFWIGMTSDGLARFEKRITGGTFMDILTVAHTVVGGKRITELSIPLVDILGAVDASLVAPGYSFRCNPLIIDGYSGFNWERTIQSFPGGASWSADTTGPNATYITFVCSPADIDGNCKVDFADFAVFAAQWLRNDCKVNDGFLCFGSDIAPQTGDGTVDILDVREFAAYWLEQN